MTRVSIALAYSPAAASETARAIAELETVRLRPIMSSNSCSLIGGTSGRCSGPGGPVYGGCWKLTKSYNNRSGTEDYE